MDTLHQQRAFMKIPRLLPHIAAAALVAGASAVALAADSGDRTSMPNSCSERDANCVIQDGAPRRRGGAADGATGRPRSRRTPRATPARVAIPRSPSQAPTAPRASTGSGRDLRSADAVEEGRHVGQRFDFAHALRQERDLRRVERTHAAAEALVELLVHLGLRERIVRAAPHVLDPA